MSEELKPCPFCGSEAMIQHTRKWYFAVCCNPDCETTGLCDLGVSGATEVWNIRPIEDALKDQIAGLEARIAALESLDKWKPDVIGVDSTAEEEA